MSAMNALASDCLLPVLLLALTAVTGFVDAVSYLALGHVFTANMTGNVVFLGFAMAAAPGLSMARSGAALWPLPSASTALPLAISGIASGLCALVSRVGAQI